MSTLGRCTNCERPMRSAGQLPMPGTVRHAGFGQCDRCRKRARQAKGLIRPPAPRVYKPKPKPKRISCRASTTDTWPGKP